MTHAKRFRLGAAVLVCMTAVALTPALATAPSGDSQRYMEEAQGYMSKGDIAAAIIQLKNAVRADAGNLPARYELALLYLRSNDPMTAERELETAKSRGFDEAKLALPLAQAYFAQGKLDAVLKIDTAKMAAQTRAPLYALQARAKIGQRDNAGAKLLVGKALAEDAASTDALAVEATLLRIENKLPEAEAEVDRALVKAPDSPDLLIMKGELRSQRGDNPGALAVFDGVVKKFPKYVRAYVARAMTRLASDDLAGAGSDVTVIRTNDPNNLMGHYLEAFLRARENKPADAAQILLAHQPLLDTYAPAEYLMAVTSLADNKPEIARGYAEHYVNRAPDDLGGQQLLATIYLRLNNPRKAVEILEPLHARAPAKADLTLALAQAYSSAGRSGEAIALFQQGLAADPGNASVQYALAVSQLQSGAKAEAETGLQKLVTANPTFTQANFALVMSQLQSHDTDKALKTAAAMIKANPADPIGYNVLGTVQLAANDPAAAATSFKTALDKDPKFATAALNLARLEEGRGNRAEAKTWYEKAITIDRRNTAAYEGLAQVALNAGDIPGAAQSLERAIVADSVAPSPRLKLITLYLEQKDNQRALIAARDFVSATPSNVDAYESLGRAQLAVGDYVNAIGSYRQIVTRMPDNSEAQRRLGRAYVAAAMSKSGDVATNWREARIAFDHALRFAPDSPQALNDSIALEQQSKGADAALALAQKLAAERADSVPRLIALGDTQMMAKKPAEAIATYRKALANDSSGAGVQRLSAALMSSGKAAEGATTLQTWITKNPADHDSRLMLVSYYIDAAKYDDAIRESETLNRAVPNNPAVLNNLAWLYGQRKDPKAFTFAAKAYELAPRSPDVSDTFGWLQVNSGDAAKGAELLGKAHDLAPDRADISYRYAVALEKRGDPGKAKAVLQKSLAAPATFTERPQAEKLLKQLGG
jgi:putative PEP-CTERM system TPR-repeat lipoprotein